MIVVALRIVFVSLLGAVIACATDTDQEARLMIRIVPDMADEEAPRGCPSASCQDYSMECGATLMLRASDPDSGAVLEDATPILDCISIPPSDTGICGIGEQARALRIPRRDMRVEVALWNPDQLSMSQCQELLSSSQSPFELFDAHGRPQPVFRGRIDLAPAMGGATYFRAAVSEDAEVLLDCHNHARLRKCEQTQSTVVRAIPRDIASLLPLRPQQAVQMTLRIGEPRNDPQEPRVFLDQTFPLRLSSDATPPSYQGLLDERFGPMVCSATLEDVPQATSSAYCEEVPEQATSFDLSPLHLPRDVLGQILSAIGLDSFPPEGLVVGRVVNQSFRPTSGVTIRPAQGTIFYLSDDLGRVDERATSGTAYFVSTDLPFGTLLRADHPDGRSEVGNPTAGLIEGKVTTTLIRLSGDVVGE